MSFQHLSITYVIGLKEEAQSNIEAAAEKIPKHIAKALWV